MAIVIVVGAVIGLVLASSRARGRGDWHPTLGQVTRSAGRFLTGSGGDGWGGPKPSSVWDKPRGDGWS